MIKKIFGTVIKGKQLGRLIGFPTVNIKLEKGILEDATFKINIVIDGKIYNGAGVFREKLELFEGHIFNFDFDVYGKKIEIIILDKIRNNVKISGFEELKELIKKDVEKIKSIKSNVLTFGSFDVVHKGHSYYLFEAKKYGDKLITIVATDKNIEKIKNFKPQNNQNKRIEDIKNLNISDEVIAGDEENPMKWIEIYSPKVICLGYDQKSYTDRLYRYIKEKKLDIEIIRIGSHKPEIYKSSLLKK